MSQRFTLAEANQLLPWLRQMFHKMAPIRKAIGQHERDLEAFLRKSRGNGGSTIEREILANRREAKALTLQIEQAVSEIGEKGVIVRDVDRGLVDFPSMREGREVHLCWLLEEDQVQFWHESDAGFAGRQPLV